MASAAAAASPLDPPSPQSRRQLHLPFPLPPPPAPPHHLQLHFPLPHAPPPSSPPQSLQRSKSNIDSLFSPLPLPIFPPSNDLPPSSSSPPSPLLVYGKHPSCRLAIDLCLDSLSLSHFRLLKRLGSGDIGCVYLVQLKDSRCCFAVKMMSKEILSSRKKFHRAHTERSILQSLHHPFLPTLYAHFETDKFLCMVMEFCSGGNLHALRQRQPNRHFSEAAVRFYAAEVLLALEYLHMMGVIYRDLKPENILIREDGHIMLSDFDLSLQCAVKPTLVKSFSLNRSAAINNQPVCLTPPCIHPACVISPNLLRRRKKRLDSNNRVAPLPELLAEPTGTQSMSFVGTYEYIAPEVIALEGHGSAVDWWAFGILLYELLYGKSPFHADDNVTILRNICWKPPNFPHTPKPSSAAQDLIKALLVKDPEQRLGSRRGATEIKRHPFFKGINWALIRSMAPPEVPLPFELSSMDSSSAEASDFECF